MKKYPRYFIHTAKGGITGNPKSYAKFNTETSIGDVYDSGKKLPEGSWKIKNAEEFLELEAWVEISEEELALLM